MALPKRKHSQARRNKRRANWNFTLPTLGRCPQCGGMVRPHRVCSACGFYRGRQVITVKSDADASK